VVEVGCGIPSIGYFLLVLWLMGYIIVGLVVNKKATASGGPVRL